MLGLWGRGACEHPRPAAPTRHPPGELPFPWETPPREESSLLYFVIINIFSPLRGDAVPFSGVLIVFILMKLPSGSLARNFRDGEAHLADEARGAGSDYWGRTADALASTPSEEAPGQREK